VPKATSATPGSIASCGGGLRSAPPKGVGRSRAAAAQSLAPAADGGEGVGGAPPPTHLAGFDVSKQQADASSDRQARMLAAAGMSATPTRAPPKALDPAAAARIKAAAAASGPPSGGRGRGRAAAAATPKPPPSRGVAQSPAQAAEQSRGAQQSDRQARMAAAAGGAGRGRGTPAKLDPAQAARIRAAAAAQAGKMGAGRGLGR